MRKVLQLLRFMYEYMCDYYLALRYSAYSPFEEKSRRQFYQMIYLAHTIEKGMSLGTPRPGFGKAKIRQLRKIYRDYDSSFSLFPLQMLLGALCDYMTLHERISPEDPWLDEVREFIQEIEQQCGCEKTGGCRDVRDAYLATTESEEVKQFMSTRFSCRSYEKTIISDDLLRSIVAMAQSAPSQCNRQTIRVHAYQERKKIEELLELQAGANGFVKDVSNLFVVSSELTGWGGPGQRNQPYVDGGLLAMNLMLACLAHGVATCPLNLAILNNKESKIRAAGDIHERERLIVMIAFGIPHQTALRAAKSPRKDIGDVLIKH